jgi:putative ABC transport system permease protein
MNAFFRKLMWLAQRRRKEAELREELRFHLDEEAEERELDGLSPEDAGMAANRDLGNMTLVQEDTRTAWGWISLWQLIQDLRFGTRVLRKSPGYTLVALLSLALGIGATTAMFSVVYGVLISPYPYARPHQIWAPLIRDLNNPQQGGFSRHRMRDYTELKKLPAISEAMATMPEGRLLTGDHDPETFTAISVTANAFQFLGVAPILGRTILPSDAKGDGEPNSVVVLTEKAWQRLFSRSPEALGKTLLLNDQPFTVIGVMPSRFGWWTNDGGWIPLREDAQDNRVVAAIMRLKDGATAKIAEEQLHALHARLAIERPNDFPKGGFTTALQNYMNVTVASGAMESSLRLLFGAVGFLLFISCANVANLQLARGTARTHEIAVRMSIGAGRRRLIRQLLTESVVLSIAGGALGIVFAFVLTKGVSAFIPESYVPNEARIVVNLYALAFSAVVSVVCGILFGLVPALKCSRPNLGDALKEASRSLAGDAGGGKTRKALVIAEITLSVVLLTGSSLTIRAFMQLQNIDLGFHSDRVLLVGIPLSPRRYATYEQRIAFSEQVVSAMRDLPGVRSIAIGNGGLPFGGPQSAYSIEGQPQQQSQNILVGLISSEYPQTMGIALRSGRSFEDVEVARAQPVALVNESAAKLLPPGTSPIGRRIRLDVLEKPTPTTPLPANISPFVTIVGVLADTRNAGRLNPPAPQVYVPYTLLAAATRTLALRTETSPMLLVNAVRERVRRIDSSQPFSRVVSLDDVVGAEIVQPRFNAALFTFFGFLGLALALAGIYSTLSYTVGRRTHEIGLRIALGARRSDVVKLILAMGGRLVVLGLVAGLVLSVALLRVLHSEIIRLPQPDLLTIFAVAVLLCCAAFLACIIPARRAARLAPVTALRT